MNSDTETFVKNFQSRGGNYADQFAAGWNFARVGGNTLQRVEEIQRENDLSDKERGIPSNTGYIDGFKARTQVEAGRKLAANFCLTGMKKGDEFFGCEKCHYQFDVGTMLKTAVCPVCGNRMDVYTVTEGDLS